MLIGATQLGPPACEASGLTRNRNRYELEMALVPASGASGASGDRGVERLGEVQSFTVKPVVDPSSDSSMTPEGYQAIFAFQQETRGLLCRAQGAAQELSRLSDRLAHLRAALAETPGAPWTPGRRLGEAGPVRRR